MKQNISSVKMYALWSDAITFWAVLLVKSNFGQSVGKKVLHPQRSFELFCFLFWRETGSFLSILLHLMSSSLSCLLAFWLLAMLNVQ